MHIESYLNNIATCNMTLLIVSLSNLDSHLIFI